MRITGFISHYNPNATNSYGFISVKIPRGAGFTFDKYFFHWTYVVQSEIEEDQIEKGCVVEFTVSDRLVKPGRVPVAVDVHVFAKPSAPVVPAAVAEALSGKDMVKS
jgi:hypothetical protein